VGPRPGGAASSPGALFGQGRHIPLRQGHLWKRTGRLWRKKYCTLLPGRLVYHTSLHAYLDNRPGKEVRLEAVTVKVAGGSGSPGGPEEGLHSLTIVSLSQRRWTFGCPGDAGGRDAWAADLRRGILACLQGDPRTLSTPLLEGVRRAAGNSHCADCGRPGPEWASVNLGLLVCIQCCGAHRSLGSHISKVRSLLLDELEPAALARLAAVGNRAAAEEWEAGLPPGERPGPRATGEQREAFVWSKYVAGRWRGPGGQASLGPPSETTGAEGDFTKCH
jgi:hypothetical protein